MKILLKILGIIVGALSLISLFQHILDVGLNPIYDEIVEYYRSIAIKIYSFIPIYISPNIIDLLNLSAIGSFAYIRTSDIEHSRLMELFVKESLPRYWKVLFFVVMWITGIGVFIFYSAINPFTYLDKSQNLMRAAVKNMLYSLIILVLFFATNAFAPSV